MEQFKLDLMWKDFQQRKGNLGKSGRRQAKEISLGDASPNFIGKPSPEAVKQMIESYLNSVSTDTIKTMSKQEKKVVKSGAIQLIEVIRLVMDEDFQREHIPRIEKIIKVAK